MSSSPSSSSSTFSPSSPPLSSLPLPSLKKQRTEIPTEFSPFSPSSSSPIKLVKNGRWTFRSLDPLFYSNSSSPLSVPSQFKYKLRIRNAHQIAGVGEQFSTSTTTSSSSSSPSSSSSSSPPSSPPSSSLITLRAGPSQSLLNVISNGGIIVGHDGNIVDVNTDDVITELYEQSHLISSSSTSSVSLSPPSLPISSSSSFSPSDFLFETEFDASSLTLLPGFVDSHTHSIWSGDRCHEFILKLQGASYLDIHKMGGGIGFTVEKTRQATDDELLTLLVNRLKIFLSYGTTTVEVKSGYGLLCDDEIRLLRILNMAKKYTKQSLIINYCGAHSIPKGKTEGEAVKDILENQIPLIESLIQKGELSVQLIDIFCEKGVFSIENTKKIISAGHSIGLQANFHGDELYYTGSAELGAEMKVLGVSHLEHISEEGMIAMAKAKTVGILLPTTAYYLRIPYPPARQMINHHVPIGLGSDFNPNAHCPSLPFVMNMSCANMKMTPEEAVNGATINSAYSLGLGEKCGTIEKGKWGDFVALDAPSWQHIVYQLVESPILFVIKQGERVYVNMEREERESGSKQLFTMQSKDNSMHPAMSDDSSSEDEGK